MPKDEIPRPEAGLQWAEIAFLTVLLIPHISTLSRGSLARNNFTFCGTCFRCFFFFDLGAMAAIFPLTEEANGQSRLGNGSGCGGKRGVEKRAKKTGGQVTVEQSLCSPGKLTTG